MAPAPSVDGQFSSLALDKTELVGPLAASPGKTRLPHCCNLQLLVKQTDVQGADVLAEHGDQGSGCALVLRHQVSAVGEQLSYRLSYGCRGVASAQDLRFDDASGGRAREQFASRSQGQVEGVFGGAGLPPAAVGVPSVGVYQGLVAPGALAREGRW